MVWPGNAVCADGVRIVHCHTVMLKATGTLLIVLLLGSFAALTLRSFARVDKGDRVAAARTKCEPVLRKLCTDASLAYPPRELFLRVFKLEQRLEVWARDTGPFTKLKSYPFTATSGQLGPKRREGDRQIPEGFYVIDRFNPKSSYHLSLRVNYPNASDRILSDPESPGSDIYIHGSDVSIGCVVVGDAAIEEVYVLCADVKAGGQAQIPVHIYPGTFDGPEWAAFQEEHVETATAHRDFWQPLEAACRAFEKTRLIPSHHIDASGRYVIDAATPAP